MLDRKFESCHTVCVNLFALPDCRFVQCMLGYDEQWVPDLQISNSAFSPISFEVTDSSNHTYTALMLFAEMK